jgi:opacity protein-like surface antigen
MRKSALALGGIALLCFPLTAHAAPQGWYLGFGAGWSTLNSPGYVLSPPTGPQTGKVDFGDEAAVSLAAGYRFEMPLRLETEVHFADYQADLLRPAGLPASRLTGDISNVSFLANAIYDIPLTRSLAFSVGAGLGATQVDPSITDSLGNRIHDSQTAFSWQVLAGFTAALSDRLELQADYRYQEIDGTDHTFLAAPISLASKNAQSVMLNLRWYVTPPVKTKE